MMPVFVWTLRDVVGLTVVLIAMLVIFVIKTADLIRMSRCKHDGGVNETQACDAICRKCGSNLGFIQTWRDKQASGDAGKGGDRG